MYSLFYLRGCPCDEPSRMGTLITVQYGRVPVYPIVCHVRLYLISCWIWKAAKASKSIQWCSRPQPETLVATMPAVLNGLAPSSMMSAGPPPHARACLRYSKQWSMWTAKTPPPKEFSSSVRFAPVTAVHQCKRIHDWRRKSHLVFLIYH